MQGDHLSINHHVDRSIQMKVDAAYFLNFGQGMLDVSAIVKAGQITDQAEAADGSPANIFDQAVVGVCRGSDHHGSAGELAVVKGEEQTGPAVDMLAAIRAQGKGATAEARETEEDGGLIPDFAPVAETTGAERGHIRGKTDTENIDVVENPVFVAQTQDVT